MTDFDRSKYLDRTCTWSDEDPALYRYSLVAQWAHDPAVKPLVFLMLNPSTADESQNDPTLERCERRAREYGHPGMVIINLFAFRATEPKDMKAAADPIGPLNDATIRSWALIAGQVVCGWGNDGQHMGRAKQVVEILQGLGVKLCSLQINEKSGEPRHPLYISYERKPRQWAGYNEGVMQ